LSTLQTKNLASNTLETHDVTCNAHMALMLYNKNVITFCRTNSKTVTQCTFKI